MNTIKKIAKKIIRGYVNGLKESAKIQYSYMY